MTDAELTDRLVVAVGDLLLRHAKGMPADQNEYDRTIVGIYLTAVAQLARFMVRHDGGITPQQLERAVEAAATELGFEVLMPSEN